jgi:hypothetical protein
VWCRQPRGAHRCWLHTLDVFTAPTFLLTLKTTKKERKHQSIATLQEVMYRHTKDGSCILMVEIKPGSQGKHGLHDLSMALLLRAANSVLIGSTDFICLKVFLRH